MSCVKLPATVAFPTDDRLLQRIEASRRALPRNNMKPLWHSRDPECSELRPELRMHEVELQPQPRVDASRGTFERFQAARAELRSTLSHMKQLYPRNRIAS
ncbi:MAG TPA: hypothetical protein VM692_05740 [Gammaproteobacteria bacterium]|nr:hypothetical protein [Gammaproteobacteria bacterium]